MVFTANVTHSAKGVLESAGYDGRVEHAIKHLDGKKVVASYLRPRGMSITETIKMTPKSTLKNLVQILNDGHEGFKQSAENVKNPSLKTLFSQFSLQRSKFAGELEAQLLSLGEEDPQHEGTTLSGKLHRGWIDLKSALTKGDDHAVLAEAERGEDAAKAAYKDALETDLPANLREIISRQSAEVVQAHNTVRDLRDAKK